MSKICACLGRFVCNLRHSLNLELQEAGYLGSGIEIAKISNVMQLPYRFGRYVLLKKIAQGGMAEIFKAKYLGESGFSKDVCIKRILPVWSEDPHFIKMLVDEAKALVHLSHPNIVQVFELGRDGKTFYISMELVEGIDLRKLFQKTAEENQPAPLKFVLYIISEILKALRFAHQKKDEEGRPLDLVHRDISPQNILLSFDGQVKVTDFGIAKGGHRSSETTQHQIKGKYAYMSPEQARGEAVDGRTDLYAAGILLYELLEGRRLFDGINDLATLELVRDAKLPDRALFSRPGALRAVVFKALQKEIEYRHQTAEEFLEEIKKIVQRERCATTAEEFSDYLQRIFPATAVDKDEETGKEFFVPQETIAPKKQKENFWIYPLFGSALMGLAGFLFWFYKGSAGEIQHAPSASLKPSVVERKIPLTGSVTVDARPNHLNGILKIGGKEKSFVTPFHLGGVDIGREKEGLVELETEGGKRIREKFVLSRENPHWVKTFTVEPEKPGVLRISARPWGEVTIPGVLTRRETPLGGLNLKAGKYRVQVSYPPANQLAEKEIQLAGGSQMVCLADFNGSAHLVCR